MTTIDSANISVWFTPAMMVGIANGSCTLNSSWRGLAPKDSAASIRSSGTCLMPRMVRRTIGGSAKIMVTTTPGTLPMPNSMTIGTR
ncbi:Uncharacterised protein [Acinetobacter baumannii]|nr:Uncharacterised protein [Acinetobacter baumannii]